MLATVAVVGCVATALKGYAAPVYEVEQARKPFRVPRQMQKRKSRKQKKLSRPEKGNFDLADGFYKGSGTGFAGYSVCFCGN